MYYQERTKPELTKSNNSRGVRTPSSIRDKSGRKPNGVDCVYSDNTFYLGPNPSNVRHGLGLLITNKPAGSYSPSRSPEKSKNDSKNTRCIYEGYFERGLYHGIGYQTYDTGRSFAGEFKSGVKHGIGKLADRGADFVGEFNNGRRDGIGILKDDKGRIIKGFYKKGVLSGTAFVDVYRSRYRYVGGFEKGLFEGVGEEVHDKVKYFGYFEKGKKHGIGFLKSGSSGESFMQSEQHSKLKIKKSDDGFNDAVVGEGKFLGNWLYDERNGFGVEVFDNHDIYEGDFSHNERTGIGRYLYKSSGYQYVGQFSEGQRVGFGKLEGESLVYIGGWRSNKRDGLGYQRLSDGRTYFGYWKNDKREGMGYEYGDKIEFKGEWYDDKPHGRGMVKISSSKAKQATFKQGVLLDKRSIDLKTFDDHLSNLDLQNFFTLGEKRLIAYEKYIDDSRGVLESDYGKIKFETHKIVQKINSQLQVLFQNLEKIFRVIGDSRKKISDNCDQLTPGELRELQYALNAKYVSEFAHGGDMYDNYASENDYRSSKQGIEKLNIENTDKYRRQTELEQDDMSMDRFRAQSHRSKVYKVPGKDSEKINPQSNKKPQAYDSQNSGQGQKHDFQIGADFKEYFIGSEQQPSNTYDVPDSARYKKYPSSNQFSQIDDYTPQRSKYDKSEPSPGQGNFVRDVGTQIQQEGDSIDPRRAVKDRSLSPPKVDISPGRSRATPSPVTRKDDRRVVDSPNVHISSPQFERERERGTQAKRLISKDPQSMYDGETELKQNHTRKADTEDYQDYYNADEESRKIFTPEDQLYGSKNTSVYSKNNPGNLPKQSNNHAIGVLDNQKGKDQYVVLAAPNNSNYQTKSMRTEQPAQSNPREAQQKDFKIQEYESNGEEDPYQKHRRLQMSESMQKKGLTPDKSLILTDSILNEPTQTKQDQYSRKYSPDRYSKASNDNILLDKVDRSGPEANRKTYYDDKLRNTNPIEDNPTRDRIQRMDINQESIYDFEKTAKPRTETPIMAPPKTVAESYVTDPNSSQYMKNIDKPIFKNATPAPSEKSVVDASLLKEPYQTNPSVKTTANIAPLVPSLNLPGNQPGSGDGKQPLSEREKAGLESTFAKKQFDSEMDKLKEEQQLSTSRIAKIKEEQQAKEKDAQIQKDLEQKKLQEEEDARILQAKHDAEVKQKKIEEETERLTKEREALELLKRQEEEKKIAKEQDDLRISKEKEDQRIAQEKEDQRIVKEKEDLRIEKEKEDLRIAQEKEDLRIAKEKEDLRIAKEKEGQRIAQEKENLRIEKEKEDQVIALQKAYSDLKKAEEDQNLKQKESVPADIVQPPQEINKQAVPQNIPIPPVSESPNVPLTSIPKPPQIPQPPEIKKQEVDSPIEAPDLKAPQVAIPPPPKATENIITSIPKPPEIPKSPDLKVPEIGVPQNVPTPIPKPPEIPKSPDLKVPEVGVPQNFPSPIPKPPVSQQAPDFKKTLTENLPPPVASLVGVVDQKVSAQNPAPTIPNPPEVKIPEPPKVNSTNGLSDGQQNSGIPPPPIIPKSEVPKASSELSNLQPPQIDQISGSNIKSPPPIMPNGTTTISPPRAPTSVLPPPIKPSGATTIPQPPVPPPPITPAGTSTVPPPPVLPPPIKSTEATVVFPPPQVLPSQINLPSTAEIPPPPIMPPGTSTVPPPPVLPPSTTPGITTLPPPPITPAGVTTIPPPPVLPPPIKSTETTVVPPPPVLPTPIKPSGTTTLPPPPTTPGTLTVPPPPVVLPPTKPIETTRVPPPPILPPPIASGTTAVPPPPVLPPPIKPTEITAVSPPNIKPTETATVPPPPPVLPTPIKPPGTETLPPPPIKPPGTSTILPPPPIKPPGTSTVAPLPDINPGTTAIPPPPTKQTETTAVPPPPILPPPVKPPGTTTLPPPPIIPGTTTVPPPPITPPGTTTLPPPPITPGTTTVPPPPIAPPGTTTLPPPPITPGTTTVPPPPISPPGATTLPPPPVLPTPITPPGTTTLPPPPVLPPPIKPPGTTTLPPPPVLPPPITPPGTTTLPPPPIKPPGTTTLPPPPVLPPPIKPPGTTTLPPPPVLPPPIKPPGTTTLPPPPVLPPPIPPKL